MFSGVFVALTSIGGKQYKSITVKNAGQCACTSPCSQTVKTSGLWGFLCPLFSSFLSRLPFVFRQPPRVTQQRIDQAVDRLFRTGSSIFLNKLLAAFGNNDAQAVLIRCVILVFCLCTGFPSGFAHGTVELILGAAG